MRISNEAARGAEQSRESSKTGKTSDVTESKSKRSGSKEKSAQIESSDKVQVSSRGKDVAKAKAIAMSTPDVDEEKVEKLRAQIQSGSYKVDSDKVADKMVDHHLETMF